MDFRSLSAPLILDGATGTGLQRRGMPAGVCSEQWILDHPEALLDLQRSYVRAGSRAVYAPSFGANRVSLGRHGLAGKTAEYNRRLAALSREAVDGGAAVGGDLSPTGLALPPVASETFGRLTDVFTEQAAALAEAGVDFFAVETQLNLAEARAAVMAVQSVSDRPILVSFVPGKAGKSLYGGDLGGILLSLEAMGVSAFGVNCCGELPLLRGITAELAALTELPLLVKPNAGMPETIDGRNVYAMTPETLAACAVSFIDAGAALLGGCCGTTEAHIAALAAAAEGRSPAEHGRAPGRWLASEYAHHQLTDRSRVAELRCDECLGDHAEAQAEKGAEVIAVRIDDEYALRCALDAQSEVRLPYLPEFADDDLRRMFLREYNGRI